MNFLRDNFAHDNGLFINETTDCTISYHGGAKVFEKTALSWDHGGHRTINPHVLQAGDTYVQQFSIDDFHPGPTSADNSNIAFYFRWQTPQAILESNGWGMYIRPDGAVTMSVNEAAQGPVGTIDSDVRYTQYFLFDETGMTIRLWGGDIPFGTLVGKIESTGMVGSNAWFELNVVSPTTVRLYDVVGSDAGGM